MPYPILDMPKGSVSFESEPKPKPKARKLRKIQMI